MSRSIQGLGPMAATPQVPPKPKVTGSTPVGDSGLTHLLDVDYGPFVCTKVRQKTDLFWGNVPRNGRYHAAQSTMAAPSHITQGL